MENEGHLWLGYRRTCLQNKTAKLKTTHLDTPHKSSVFFSHTGRIFRVDKSNLVIKDWTEQLESTFTIVEVLLRTGAVPPTSPRPQLFSQQAGSNLEAADRPQRNKEPYLSKIPRMKETRPHNWEHMVIVLSVPLCRNREGPVDLTMNVQKFLVGSGFFYSPTRLDNSSLIGFISSDHLHTHIQPNRVQLVPYKFRLTSTEGRRTALGATGERRFHSPVPAEPGLRCAWYFQGKNSGWRLEYSDPKGHLKSHWRCWPDREYFPVSPRTQPMATGSGGGEHSYPSSASEMLNFYLSCRQN